MRFLSRLVTSAVICVVQQIPDEEEKSDSGEDDKEIACSPVPMTAERRRSLWYASHYTTDERKVRLKWEGSLH